MRDTDVYHITVSGVNPHEIAEEMQQEGSPFETVSVAQQVVQDGQILGGVVEIWTVEHPTTEQERFLQDNPHVIDIRHVWP